MSKCCDQYKPCPCGKVPVVIDAAAAGKAYREGRDDGHQEGYREGLLAAARMASARAGSHRRDANASKKRSQPRTLSLFAWEHLRSLASDLRKKAGKP